MLYFVWRLAMKQKQVHRHIHDEVHYTFENNTLALQQVDVQKDELWKLVQENQCQPLIDELNQEAETDFILFSSQEMAEFFQKHPHFKIIKTTPPPKEMIFSANLNEKDFPFQLFAYDVAYVEKKPMQLEPFEEAPEMVTIGEHKGKWLRFFQVPLPSKPFAVFYHLAQDIKDGRIVDSVYVSDLHYYFYHRTQMKDIAGMLRTGGFCFMNHFEYKVPGRTLDEVDGFLNNLFENYQNRWQNLHPIEKAVSLHNEMIALQPFHDGNKRIARLVLNSILLEHGYPTIQLRQGQNALYVQAVKEGVLYQNGQPMFTLVMQQVKKQLEKYKEAVQACNMNR